MSPQCKARGLRQRKDTGGRVHGRVGHETHQTEGDDDLVVKDTATRIV